MFLFHLQLWNFETFLELKLKGNVISFCDPYVHEIVCALLQVGQKQADARINLVNMQQWHTVVARGKRADRSTCNLHFLKPPPPNNFTHTFLCKYLPVPLLKSKIVHFSLRRIRVSSLLNVINSSSPPWGKKENIFKALWLQLLIFLRNRNVRCKVWWKVKQWGITTGSSLWLSFIRKSIEWGSANHRTVF